MISLICAFVSEISHWVATAKQLVTTHTKKNRSTKMGSNFSIALFILHFLCTFFYWHNWSCYMSFVCINLTGFYMVDTKSYACTYGLDFNKFWFLVSTFSYNIFNSRFSLCRSWNIRNRWLSSFAMNSASVLIIMACEVSVSFFFLEKTVHHFTL